MRNKLQYLYFVTTRRNVTVKFCEVLKEAGSLTTSPLTIFIDGINMLDDTDMARTLQWLPETLPQVLYTAG